MIRSDDYRLLSNHRLIPLQSSETIISDDNTTTKKPDLTNDEKLCLFDNNNNNLPSSSSNISIALNCRMQIFKKISSSSSPQSLINNQEILANFLQNNHNYRFNDDNHRFTGQPLPSPPTASSSTTNFTDLSNKVI